LMSHTIKISHPLFVSLSFYIYIYTDIYINVRTESTGKLSEHKYAPIAYRSNPFSHLYIYMYIYIYRIRAKQTKGEKF